MLSALNGESGIDADILLAIEAGNILLESIDTAIDAGNVVLGTIDTAVDAGNVILGTIDTAIDAGNVILGTIDTAIDAIGAANSISHLVSAATTNATVIKASPGTLMGWLLSNTTTSAKYIKFHNSAISPTAGADVFFSFMIPASASANVSFGAGVAFSAGIGITLTGGFADNDTTALAVGDVIANIIYK
jgi:hypothetical protein